MSVHLSDDCYRTLHLGVCRYIYLIIATVTAKKGLTNMSVVGKHELAVTSNKILRIVQLPCCMLSEYT
jgi:hypothetical protein